MGLQQPQASLTLDPEYVKLQRKEILEKYSEKILELKNEISELELKKADLENYLKSAFKDRLELVESRERAQKQSEKETSLGASALIESKERFSAEKEAASNIHESRLSELRAETRKSESILSSARAESLKIEELKKKVDDYGKRVADQEALNIKELERLKAEKDALSEERGRIQALRDSIEPMIQSVESQKQVLSIRQNSANQEIQELNSSREALKEERIKNQESIQDLKALKLSTEQVLKTNNDVLSDIKIREQAIKENENKFKVWEQSSKAEISIKSRELDEREARIKKLESQVGGK